MRDLVRDKRVLAIVAHPDDEVLGPGGSLHKLTSRRGCAIRAVILGEGITSRGDVRDRARWGAELERHRENIHQAASAIGFESVGIYDFADNRFDSHDLLDIVKVVEKEKAEFEPEVIFTHHGGDTNIDHQLTFQAVVTATRPMEGEKVRAILAFETPSSTEWQAANHPNYFRPNVYITLEREDLDAKIAAMESYELEKRAYPHPRSPEALGVLAKRHGVTVGASYAEAFMLIRAID